MRTSDDASYFFNSEKSFLGIFNNKTIPKKRTMWARDWRFNAISLASHLGSILVKENQEVV